MTWIAHIEIIENAFKMIIIGFILSFIDGFMLLLLQSLSYC